MDKLSMCRICLVQNVRMYVVVNKSLQELYETLTDVPFVTKDRRPMLACFFCCAKIKQCAQFQRRCVQAEQLFTQMLREDWEPNPLINIDQLNRFGGFVKTPVENINIGDEYPTESKAIKEELLDACESQYEPEHLLDNIEDNHNDDPEQEYVNNNEPDIKDSPPQYEVDSETDIAEIRFKTQVKIEEVPTMKLTAIDEWVAALTTPDHDLQRRNLEDTHSASIQQHQQKIELNPKYTQNIYNRTSKNVTKFKDSKYGLKSNQVKTINQPNLMPDERPYKCEICQHSFPEERFLKNHIRVHTGEQPYQCDICQRGFKLKNNLINHIRVHTGEKPFQCNICHSKFKEASALKKHLKRIHSGVKPYKCDICLLSFSDRSYLKNHLKTHGTYCNISSHDYKPYKCDKCLSCFRYNSQLNVHIRVHSGETPFKCHICQVCYRYKTNLIRHNRRHGCDKLIARL